MLVFSLTQEASLRDVDHIRQQIYRIKGGEEDIPIVVVGTKMDLVRPCLLVPDIGALMGCDDASQTGEREVSSQQMQELAVQWGLPFYETSAKKGWHVNEVFNHLLVRMRKRYPDGMPRGHRHRRRDGQCVVM